MTIFVPRFSRLRTTAYSGGVTFALTSPSASPATLTDALDLPAITPRLVATDLDGTVIPHGGAISERTLAVFAHLAERNIPLVIATGRPPRWVTPVIEATGHQGWIVCGNGGLTMDLSGGEPDIVQGIDAATLAQIAVLLREAVPGIALGIESINGLGVESRFRTVRETTPTEGMAPAKAVLSDITVTENIEELSAEPGIFKLIAATNDTPADELARIAHEALDDLVTVTHSSAELSIIEISALGVSKAKALDEIAERFGISPSEAIAFGDMPNDVEMLQWAGVGYAMASGHPAALAAADAVAPRVEDDGFAVVMERLLAVDAG